MRSARFPLLSALLLGLAAVTSALTQPSPVAPRPQTYGGSVVSYVRVPGIEFFPGGSAASFVTDDGLLRYCTSSVAPAVFAAPVHLPAGAKIVYLELDFNDATPSAAVTGTLEICDFLAVSCTNHPINGGGADDCPISGYICSGQAFAGGRSAAGVDVSGEGLVVDNVNNAYVLNAGNGSLDSTTKIAGMLVGYVLQVSPAPATPTFTDVPNSDFAFQFIEAFSAAGITAGCETSPAKYCPDRNVTRREMAVFFAKALGLQFP